MTPSQFFSPTTYWIVTVLIGMVIWLCTKEPSYGESKSSGRLWAAIFGGLFFGIFLGLGGREILLETLTTSADSLGHDYSECDRYDPGDYGEYLRDTTILYGANFKPAEYGTFFRGDYKDCLKATLDEAITTNTYDATVKYIVRQWKWDVIWPE